MFEVPLDRWANERLGRKTFNTDKKKRKQLPQQNSYT